MAQIDNCIAFMTALSFSKPNSCQLYSVWVPWNWGMGGPNTGQIVPGSGIVPFSKYALMYLIVQTEGPEIEVC